MKQHIRTVLAFLSGLVLVALVVPAAGHAATTDNLQTISTTLDDSATSTTLECPDDQAAISGGYSITIDTLNVRMVNVTPQALHHAYVDSYFFRYVTDDRSGDPSISSSHYIVVHVTCMNFS